MMLATIRREDPNRAAAESVALSRRFGDFEVWEGIPESQIPHYTRYTCPSYTYWKYLLDWNGKGGVFLLESSLGQDSLALSDGFDYVVSLVPDSVSGERVKALARYHGRDNIHVCETSQNIDKYFDGIKNVALHDFSDFMASAANQQEALSTVQKVLVASTQATTIYISGMRGGALQSGSAKISELIAGNRRDCGASIKVLFDSRLRDLSELIATGAKGKTFLAVRPFISRYLAYARLFRRTRDIPVEGEFLYISPSARTFFELVIDKMKEGSACTGDIRVDYIRKGNPVNVTVSLTREDGGGFILRIPMNKYADDRTRKAYENLKLLESNCRGTKGIVPMPEGTWHVNGGAVYLETRIEGICIESRRSMDDGLYQMCAEWIAEFHKQTMCRRKFSEEDFKRLVEEPISFIGAGLGRDVGPRFECLKSRLAERLIGREFTFVFMHGDFKLENILFRKDLSGISGVIDWDLASEQGFPVVDLLNMILFHRKCLTRRPDGRILEEIIRQTGYTDDERRILAKYFRWVGIGEDEDFGLFLSFFWLHHVSQRFNPSIWGVDGWRENVGKILDIILNPENEKWENRTGTINV